MHERAVYVQDRATELRRAANIADAQALVVKGDLLNATLRIRRRAHALAEEQPEVLKPWGRSETGLAKLKVKGPLDGERDIGHGLRRRGQRCARRARACAESGVSRHRR
jgi:hypothetical protein